MRFGIVVFPGTWSDRDFGYVLKNVLEQEIRYVWHKDQDLKGLDCVMLPGGFSYGDYLRTGAIARFSPVMRALGEFAANGGLVIGSCNGFQILCEAGLLPGALLRNEHLEFRCQWTNLLVENSQTSFTAAYSESQVLRMPISHGEGRYYADEETIMGLEANGQVIFRYSDANGNPTLEANPNGSLNNIAGIVNQHGNVLGLMPHPERACETLLGGQDGIPLFQSLFS